jgi:hypothetical protein
MKGRINLLSCVAVILVLVASPFTWGATKLLDFESDAYCTNAGAGLCADVNCSNNPVPPLFNRPGYGYQTSQYLESPAACGQGTYASGTLGSDSFLTEGIAADGLRSDQLNFSWLDPGNDSSWVRVPTYAAGGVTPLVPNPTVYIGAGGSVQMSVALFGTDGAGGEAATSGELEFALCIRETGQNLPLGADGGAAGTVEFVGVTSGTTGADGKITASLPVGGTPLTAPPDQMGIAFHTIKWTFVDTTVPADGKVEAVDISVDGDAPVRKGIVGYSGDGILSADYSRGAICDLAIRKAAGDTTKKWYVWVDDVVIDSAGLPEPVQVQSIVVSYMTEVTVSNIDPGASQVNLYKNDVLYKSQAFAPGAAPASYKFTGCTFVKNDKLEAAQVISGIESGKSAPVLVQDAVVFSDNFDNYVDQAAFNVAWPSLDGCVQPTHTTLSRDTAASCQQSALEPGSTTNTPCRTVHNLGAYLDGSDDVPLTLTVWMKSTATAGANNYVELRSNRASDGALQQLLAIGMYNAVAGGATLYQGREAYGTRPDGTVVNWFNIDGATRTANTWVKLQIKVKTSTVDFIVNGTSIHTEPRTNTVLFNNIVIGSGLSNNGVSAYYDNLGLSLGEPPTEPFGDPNPVPLPTIATPVLPNATSVTVNGLDAAATQVNVYVDSALAGSASLSGETSKAVTVPALSCGATVNATQVKADVESCYSTAVTVSNPLPTLQTPLTAGDTTVTVNNIVPTATQVKVYANNALIGSAAVSGESTKTVTVSPALVVTQLVEAAQIVAGIECGRSAAVTVQEPVVEGWTETSAFPSFGIAESALIYANGYVYSFGGRTSTGVVTDAVYYAAVQTNGSIGAWQTTTVLPHTLCNEGAAVYSGRVYVWGGFDNAGPTQNACYYASQNPDGSLGSWTTAGATIPNAADGDAQMEEFGRGLMIFNDTIYVIAGADNGGHLQTSCYYSKIGSGGDIGSWVSTSASPDVVWYHGLAVIQGTSANYMYRIGGIKNNVTQTKTLRATINADGSLGPWTTEGPQLPNDGSYTYPYSFGCAVAEGNKIFVVAGNNDNDAPTNRVFVSEVDLATGAIGPWKQDVHPYPITIGRNMAVAYEVGGSWYVLGAGGATAGYTTRTKRCFYAKLSGGCAAPTVTSIAPPIGRQGDTAHVTIAGTNFVVSATTVALKKTGQPDIAASNVVVAGDGKSLTCDLDLVGQALGLWDVVVNTCAQATLPGAFEVKRPLPTVASITPNHGVQDNGNLPVPLPYNGTGPVPGAPVHVTIAGANFVAGATVKLVHAGKADINAVNVTVVNAGTITADIDLTGAAPGALDGAWDVVVHTDGDGTLPAGFTVSMCFAPRQDTDGDGDIDLADFGVFQGCFNGPNRPYNPPPIDPRKCACLDIGDNPVVPDVDLADFGAFQGCFNGPNRPKASACGQ